jgi:3-methyl-2-oxobutanoate hydroxymethyltransferase
VTVTIPALHAMKRAERKIVGVVAWDYQIARIADRTGVELVSAGDSVGVNLWGHESELDVTLEEMIVVGRAVRRGVKRALVSVDLPPREGTDGALRLAEETGADMVKLDGDPQAVTAIARAGIPVFAQMEPESDDVAPDELVERARRLERAGASLIDFKHSGPVAGPAVARAVEIPVLGGLGGGPWLDGRMRMAHAAIGYAASCLDDPPETYANVAQVTHEALAAYAEDVRAARQIKGAKSRA